MQLSSPPPKFEEDPVSILETTNVQQPSQWDPQIPEKMPGTGKYDPSKGKVFRLEKSIEKKWEKYLDNQKLPSISKTSRNGKLKVSRTTKNTRLPSIEHSFTEISSTIAKTDEIQELVQNLLQQRDHIS